MSESEVGKNLKKAYDSQYDAKMSKWRELGAKSKAQNIVELCKSINAQTLIEVGAGEGSILQWLDQWGFSSNMTAVEISESGVEEIKKRQIKSLNEIKLFDGYKLPFDDNSFDLAICSHVIEHVEHPRILLRELARISKRQLMEIPIDFSFSVDKRYKHFLSYGHINIFNPSLFRFLLKSEGFEIISDKNAMYSNEIHDFQYKSRKLKLLKIKFKKFIWEMTPFLLRNKPNTYTVLTQKIDDLKIL